MEEQNSPRIVTECTKVYRRIPKLYRDELATASLYQSFSRFPVENPHWRHETITFNGEEYMLHTLLESHYNKDGKVFHSFRETETELVETTFVYLETFTDEYYCVAADSKGTVIITKESDIPNNNTPNGIIIHNGRIGGLQEAQWTSAQEEYYRLEEEYNFGVCQEIEMTEVEKAAAKEILDKGGRRREILEKDRCGKPTKELLLDCDEILDLTFNEYIYEE